MLYENLTVRRWCISWVKIDAYELLVIYPCDRRQFFICRAFGSQLSLALFTKSTPCCSTLFQRPTFCPISHSQIAKRYQKCTKKVQKSTLFAAFFHNFKKASKSVLFWYTFGTRSCCATRCACASRYFFSCMRFVIFFFNYEILVCNCWGINLYVWLNAYFWDIFFIFVYGRISISLFDSATFFL